MAVAYLWYFKRLILEDGTDALFRNVGRITNQCVCLLEDLLQLYSYLRTLQFLSFYFILYSSVLKQKES